MVVSAPAFKGLLIPHLSGAVVQEVKYGPGVDSEKQQHALRLKATGISNRAIANPLRLAPSTIAKYLGS